MKEEQAKAAGPEPEQYVPWSKVREICARIMKESDELQADSNDYRIGQWSGAEKAMFEIDCWLSNNRASPSAGQWIAFDIGCIECGEESAVIGVYSTEKEAEAACEKAAELQKAAWTGEHHMEVFQLPAPPLSDIKREK